jgi:hypothetical protein
MSSREIKDADGKSGEVLVEMQKELGNLIRDASANPTKKERLTQELINEMSARGSSDGDELKLGIEEYFLYRRAQFPSLDNMFDANEKRIVDMVFWLMHESEKATHSAPQGYKPRECSMSLIEALQSLETEAAKYVYLNDHRKWGLKGPK